MHGEKINDGLIFWGLRLELEVKQSDVGYLTVTFKSFENAVFGATNLETEKTVLKHWKRMISEGTLTLLDDGTCTIPAEVLVNNMIKPAWFAVRDCIERYPNGFKLGDMRVGGFRVIAITNITDSCYYTHNPSLSSWRGTSEKSKRS